MAEGTSTAVLLDLSEVTATGKAGSAGLYADAVLAIDPDRPAVHVHRSGALVAIYEPAIGLVGDMVVVS